ncbi:MAG: hypothetical protein KBD76_09525 [Bacteriovorax sp.]|nr:hypothetical protein [Bacteriovorax sp.]
MEQKLRIEGIYDQRTLKHLKQKGLKDFCFDFSPKSFNFIQEYVFLEQFLNFLDPTDRIFFHFTRSNDPMVNKLIEDLKKSGISLSHVYFEFDEWTSEMTPLNFKYNYLLHYAHNIDLALDIGENFKGFIFHFHFFEELHLKNILIQFTNNFYTRFNSQLKKDHLLLLKIDWHSDLLSSLFDLVEFDLLSCPINSKIEVCYRNVDLKKLTSEMEFLKKNQFILQGM